MKKLILSIIGITTIIGSILLCHAKEYGQYKCPYYIKGKTQECVIIVSTQGSTLSPNCPFLTSEQKSNLINGKKCKFTPTLDDSIEKYSCKYPAGECKVTIKGGSTYSATCTEKLDGKRAIKDTKDGLCKKISTNKSGSYICEYADTKCKAVYNETTDDYEVSCTGNDELSNMHKKIVIEHVKSGMCLKESK